MSRVIGVCANREYQHVEPWLTLLIRKRPEIFKRQRQSIHSFERNQKPAEERRGLRSNFPASLRRRQAKAVLNREIGGSEATRAGQIRNKCLGFLTYRGGNPAVYGLPHLENSTATSMKSSLWLGLKGSRETNPRLVKEGTY